MKTLEHTVSVNGGKFLRNHVGPNDESVVRTLAFLPHTKEFVGVFVHSLHVGFPASQCKENFELWGLIELDPKKGNLGVYLWMDVSLCKKSLRYLTFNTLG